MVGQGVERLLGLGGLFNSLLYQKNKLGSVEGLVKKETGELTCVYYTHPF